MQIKSHCGVWVFDGAIQRSFLPLAVASGSLGNVISVADLVGASNILESGSADSTRCLVRVMRVLSLVVACGSVGTPEHDTVWLLDVGTRAVVML